MRATTHPALRTGTNPLCERRNYGWHKAVASRVDAGLRMARPRGGSRPPMALHVSKKGLDLPLAGAPAPRIDTARAVSRVALLGADYVGLKPALLVEPGARVRRGQPVIADRSNPGVRLTAPAGGRVAELHRGQRRAFVALVIEVGPEDATPAQFAHYDGRAPDAYDAPALRALLQESGLWTALRTRPFGRIPAVDATPAALFVTATDTRPHAPPPQLVLAERGAAFRTGLGALARLAQPLFLCIAPGTAVDAPPGVQVEIFKGPHPAGNVGWHVHRLLPVHAGRSVWHIGYQDVVAIGHLLATGELDVSRVISLGGPGIARPRLLRTRIGAATDEIVAGELAAGEQRVISGSVLDGRAARGAAEGYLGRYHLQIAALPEGRGRELFGFITPGADKFSVTGAVLGAFRRAHRFVFSTSTNGSPRAMVPIGTYERVLPFDMLPTFLLRALITGQDERAAELGALELDEDDVALATYVCPGKYDYGPLLRATLERLRKEYG
jgi:Na+-transporting NADH:ubiquinone oxidoreductase subunit A